MTEAEARQFYPGQEVYCRWEYDQTDYDLVVKKIGVYDWVSGVHKWAVQAERPLDAGRWVSFIAAELCQIRPKPIEQCVREGLCL